MIKLGQIALVYCRDLSSKLRFMANFIISLVVCGVEIYPPCSPSPLYQIAIRCTGDQYMTSLGVGPVPR